MRYLFILLMFWSCTMMAQTGGYNIYLAGDCGEDTAAGPALKKLQQAIQGQENAAVVFLGDNVYPAGLDTTVNASRLRIAAQLNVVNGFAGRVFFIPGNHDWHAQKRDGGRYLAEQEEYVNRWMSRRGVADKTAAFQPAGGLPGPSSFLLTAGVRLIIIDTQWFLQRKKITRKECRRITGNFYAVLDSLLLLASRDSEQVVIAAHHPIYTDGQHSKRRQPWRFLVNYTPFQLFGLAGLNRLFSQDIDQPVYRKMRRRLLSSIQKYNNITFVSGHDHNLQELEVDGKKYFVSGAGSKLSHLRKRHRFKMIFGEDTRTGFLKLHFENGKMIAEFILADPAR